MNPIRRKVIEIISRNSDNPQNTVDDIMALINTVYELPTDWREKLFSYMSSEHDVTMLDTDMNEVRHIILGDKMYLEEANKIHNT
jgi:hypothetical protein